VIYLILQYIYKNGGSIYVRAQVGGFSNSRVWMVNFRNSFLFAGSPGKLEEKKNRERGEGEKEKIKRDSKIKNIKKTSDERNKLTQEITKRKI